MYLFSGSFGGASLSVGVSTPYPVAADLVQSMAPGPILFPMANPAPEIMPDAANAAGASAVDTGRSSFPNQAAQDMEATRV